LIRLCPIDGKFSALNNSNDDLLWEVDLPNPAFTMPPGYELNGRQYLVLACGGGKNNTRSRDSYVAFTVPENK
jgi:quinoprotein glucose dehydrogenase